MRRLLDIGLDALQFQRLHGGGLALNFLFQAFDDFDLIHHDGVQFFHLMLQVGKVGFKFFKALGNFVSHAGEFTAKTARRKDAKPGCFLLGNLGAQVDTAPERDLQVASTSDCNQLKRLACGLAPGEMALGGSVQLRPQLCAVAALR